MLPATQQLIDPYHTQVEVDGKNIGLGLWKTPGHADYDRLRPLSYPETDVFLLCFSVDSPASLEHIASKWNPEVEHHAPVAGVCKALVGLKADLRETNQLAEDGKVAVTAEQGAEMAARIGAVKYLECSALTQQGASRVQQPF